MRLSDEVVAMQPPASIRSAQGAREMIAAGRPVIDLTAGQPDFPTPPEIIEATARALRDGQTGYTASAGITALREGIAAHLHTKHGVPSEPSRVLVTPGAKAALFDLLRAALNPGDRVLVPQPSWLSYSAMVSLAGGVPVPVAALAEENFIPRLEVLEKAADGAHAIILNNPVNPTGAIWPVDALAGLADIATRHDLLVISDEIYDDLLFDVDHVPSIAAFDGMDDRVVQVHGFSKTYAMTGFRLGYLRGPLRIVEQVQKVHEQIATCASSVSQHAGLAALDLDQASHLAGIRQLYRSRRDAVRDACRRVGIGFIEPGGAFYLFVDLRDRWASSLEGSVRILESCLVASVPGVAYGDCSEGWLRLSLTAPADVLVEAIERIANLPPSGLTP